MGVDLVINMAKLVIAHTPDPDDAYMFYGLVSGAVSVPGFDEVEQIVEDIETLNKKVIGGWNVDVTALSAHAYAYVMDRYYLLRTGVSMGEGYGPMVVAKRRMQLSGIKIAVPGEYTTARLLLKLATGGNYSEIFVRFDKIIDMVLNEEVDAGLLIHDAQLTYSDMGLLNIFDLWQWWKRVSNGLPMPLGVDVVNKRLGRNAAINIRKAIQESIRYAWNHDEEAINYASKFSRTGRRIGEFVKMYVNQRTLDMGDDGIRAHELLYRLAHSMGLPGGTIEVV